MDALTGPVFDAPSLVSHQYVHWHLSSPPARFPLPRPLPPPLLLRRGSPSPVRSGDFCTNQPPQVAASGPPYYVSMDNSAQHERTLERLRLCRYAVEEVLAELRIETDPVRRADLLIETESLSESVLELLLTVRDVAWFVPTPEHPVPVSDPDRPSSTR